MKKAPLFLLGWLFVLFSCKEDDFRHEAHQHSKTEKNQITFREFLDIEGHKPEVQKIKKYFQGAGNGKFARGEDSVNWEIDTVNIIEIATPEITTYTFGVIEHEPIDGFRNVIIKQTDAETKAYLVHYPQGIDLETQTPAHVYIEEIEASVLGAGRIKNRCYIMIFTCLWCHEQSCTLNQGWMLQEVKCADDSGGGGGGGNGGDNPNDPWGGDEPGLPTDPTAGGGGSGDNNNNQTPCQSLTLKIMQHNF